MLIYAYICAYAYTYVATAFTGHKRCYASTLICLMHAALMPHAYVVSENQSLSVTNLLAGYK